MSLRLARPVRLSSVLLTTFAVTSLTVPHTGASQHRSDSSQSQSAVQVPAVARYGELPLAFEANRGQTSASVRFVARGNGYSLYLTGSEAVLALHKSSDCRMPKMRMDAKAASCAGKSGTRPDVVRMKLAGVAATLSPKSTGEDELPGKVNYFFGNDPTKWHTNLPTYKRVRFAGVYPGVDLIYYGNQRQLEYDFVVGPNADPKHIQLRFSRTGKLSLTSEGDLTLTSRGGQIAFHKPEIYQETNGRRRAVEGHFILMANHAIGFAVGSYDHAQPLIIDPVLVYSTYLGGDYFDPVQGITVDSSGNAYVAGYSSSGDFPVTPGAYNVTGCGAFVTKINATGTALIYSTRLAGTCLDTADGIAVDSSGNAYVTGGTQGAFFPVTPGAFQTTKKSPYMTWTGFVTKLDPTGSTLLYSTYLGGSSGEAYGFIALDGAGNAYVAGASQSADFPVTSGAFQTVKKGGAGNAVVSLLNSTGTALLYSTFIGGSGSSHGGDQAMGIKLDSSGNVHLTGYTQSADFPVTPGAFQSTLKGGCNVFIAEINPTLSKLVHSTYLGGSGATLAGSSLQPCSGDFAQGFALDSSGNSYVSGSTTSSDFPVTTGAFQTTNRNSQGTGFVAEMNQDGSELLYSTYLGGSGDGSYGDFATSLDVDNLGDAYVTGWTSSADFPVTPGAFQTTNGFVKVFATKLNPTGTGLLYSTFLGGSISVGWGPYPGDEAWAAALDEENNFYVAGVTQSTDFPVTPGAFQTTNNAAASRGHTGFVTKMTLTGTNLSPSSTTIEASTASLQAGQPITLTANVTSASGSGTPTGEVTFTGVGRPSPVVTLDANGEAGWTSSTLAPGTYSASVLYSGDETYGPSNSQAVTFSVSAGQPAKVIAVGGPYWTAQYGKGLSICAEVTDAGSDLMAGVTVNFSGSNLVFTPAAPVSNASGQACTAATPLTIGGLAATASVAGVSTPATFNLAVTPAPLIVTVLPSMQRRPYGSPNPIFAANASGLVNGDTLGGSIVVSISTIATQVSPVGNYPVVATVGGSASSNYTANIRNAELIIVKTPLRVYAPYEPQIFRYGQAIPIPSLYTFQGFVNGDTQATAVTGEPVLTNTATSTSPIGRYAIDIAKGTLSAQNYLFWLYKGVLEIYRARLTVTATSFTLRQGQPIPPLTFTITGFVNGETQSIVTGAPILYTPATSSSLPGVYPIQVWPGTLKAPNYEFLYSNLVNGTVTITSSGN